MVMSFIDSHRQELGIEPICRELAFAPSSYHEHAARLADPGKRSFRARRDDEIKEQIKRVHDDSSGLYGTRKVWHQMRREGIKVAKCTVERLMRVMGLTGVIPPLGSVDSLRDSLGADFLIRCCEHREACDGGSDWGSRRLLRDGFTPAGATLH